MARRRDTGRGQRGSAAYQTGLWAERLACLLLLLKLYRILGTRVKTRAGEVDIVAARGRTLVIVEVKARRTKTEAAEALQPHQQQRLARAAELLLAQHPAMETVRFDVIAFAPKSLPHHMRDAWRP